MNKDKYQMTSNNKKKKLEMNWSMTTMNNMRLYLSMMILKQLNKIKIREDLLEQGINIKPWIPRAVENCMHKTVQIKDVQFYDN